MKSRRMGWVRLKSCMEEKTNAYKVLVGKPEGNKPPEDLRTEGRIIFKSGVYGRENKCIQ
jgi:UTP-glucose-1-phosphate uridylyltransferase